MLEKNSASFCYFIQKTGFATGPFKESESTDAIHLFVALYTKKSYINESFQRHHKYIKLQNWLTYLSLKMSKYILSKKTSFDHFLQNEGQGILREFFLDHSSLFLFVLGDASITILYLARWVKLSFLSSLKKVGTWHFVCFLIGENYVYQVIIYCLVCSKSWHLTKFWDHCIQLQPPSRFIMFFS